MKLPEVSAGFSWQGKGAVRWLRADLLQDHGAAVAAFSTRVGGVSQGPYAALNLSAATGDEPGAVHHNRVLLASALERPLSSWVFARQVHGRALLEVDAGRLTAGAEAQVAGTGDAMITRDPRATLVILTADCVPILLRDAGTGWVAAVHAGWRGTVAGIAGAVVRDLVSTGRARPESLYAAIGPSIGPCCYEVDEVVLGPLHRAFVDAATLTVPTRPGHARLDLWEANRRDLVQAGVPAEHVRVSGLCTRCHLPLFYSHRFENGVTGRFAAIVAPL